MRLIKYILLPVFLSAPVFSQTVSFCENYDNRTNAVISVIDDMYNMPSHEDSNWTNFIDSIELARSNYVVQTVAVIVGLVTDTNGWTELQAQIEDGYCIVGNHSWDHPVATNEAGFWTNQYINSRQGLYDWLELPERFTYNGSEYLNAMLQWGGSDLDENDGYGKAQAFMGTNGYLLRRGWAGAWTPDQGWPEWDSTNGLYEPIPYGMGVADVLDGGYSNDFNTAYNNRSPYVTIFHPASPADDVYGINAAQWAAYYDFIGNRKDTWGCSPNEWITYHYTITRASLTNTTTDVGGHFYATLSADDEERNNFGLSYPITMFIENVVYTNMGFGGFAVWKQDAGETTWTELTEKTTNDYFNSIECFRVAGDDVYVSVSLPQATNSVTVRCGNRRNKLAAMGGF